MPYCPECRCEYEERVKICPDCGVTLVKELPRQPELEMNNEPMVHIATAPNEPLAMMWKEILENEGIHSLIKSRDLRAAMYMPSLLSRCEIYVLESQAEEAKRAISPFIEE